MAPADAALAVGYPGDNGARQPVHTVYVPADRVTADLVAGYGEAALATLVGHGPAGPRGDRRRRSRADDRGLAAAAGQALERAGRGPADRPGGRLPRPFRRRGGRRRRRGGPGRGGCSPALLGGAVQVLRGHHPGPWAAHARPGARRCPGDRSAPGRLPAHAAEGDLGRAGPRDGGDLWPAGDGVRARRRSAVLRGPGRDAPGHPGTRRGRDRGPARPRGGRVAATGCTSAPTTTRPRSGSPPDSRRWTTRSPTMPRT